MNVAKCLAIMFASLMFCIMPIRAADQQAEHAQVRLESMNLGLIQTGWGKPQACKSVIGEPLVIGEKKYDKGIGVHAPSSMTIKLDGKAIRFTAEVGVNSTGGNEAGEVEFVVRCDKKILWRSGIVKKGDKAKQVDVQLKGVSCLELSVDPCGEKDSDHADWADAMIEYSAIKPEIIEMIECSEIKPEIIDSNAGWKSESLYPPAEKLRQSAGGTSYYINPQNGDDSNSGTSGNKAWKTFAKINALKLAEGDKVVVFPGIHEVSMKPSGGGSAGKPVIIQFLPGVHEIAENQAVRLPLFVSNSCDAPAKPKPIGIMMNDCKHIHLTGAGTGDSSRSVILLGGRMVEVLNKNSEDIVFKGLTFDLKRSTVSEFRVLEAAADRAVIQIAEKSDYAVEDGMFKWKGDWGTGGLLCQESIPEEGRCWRRGNPRGWTGAGQSQALAKDLGGRKVELQLAGGLGLTAGHQYHFRLISRDSVGVHNTRCKNIVFQDCDFYALTNMGLVSQFTENIIYSRVNVAPPAGTIRTCAAWADIFQFSNCRGDILVENCRLSGMQDDAINCHGTHLRIIDKPAENQLLVRFMHPQTYGFAAFVPGDEVAVINHANLREYVDNPRRKVTAVEKEQNKDWLWRLTLDGPVPAYNQDDVLDNITWYPNLTARNNHISMDPCRGFLLTTRGKVLVESNTFWRCSMPGILIEDDAEGWYESGPVRDMTIRKNKFIGCGININPMTSSNNPDEPVHENIRIEDNLFNNAGISAKNTKNLVVINNRSVNGNISIKTSACADAKIENNQIKEGQ